MIRIEYSKEGTPVSDFDCATIAENLSKIVDEPIQARIFNYSTGNIFYAIRLLIALDKLDYNKVVFVYKGEEIKINRFAAITTWPEGFCTNEIRICETILKTAINKRKKEKENVR
jgi:hypothetical protein